MNPDLVRQIRTLLVLSRVSNLPTVWSNCLAGWWLGGGGNFWKLPPLLFGVSALYIGGMFLNDAFDAEFDRRRRPSRPIASGTISPAAVWRWSFGWLGLGALSLAGLGKSTGVPTLALVACIIIYDATHQGLTASPWLMGLCRFWVYVVAGATGAWELNGWPIWCGAALGLYVVGVGSVAQKENTRGPVPVWTLLLMAAPVILSLLINAGEARKAALLLSLVLGLWIARCVRRIFVPAGEANFGRVVYGLQAGIVFVDWLAVGPQPEISHALSGGVFLALFGATLAFQRFAPVA
jgi:4-hydroxybenzoate polyprenyltransferase